MSFFSDLFHGNVGNLGHDLNPSNAFSDFGSDLSKGLKNPIVDVALGAGALALPFLAPELLGGLGGLFGGTAAADAGAVDLGAVAGDFATTGSLDALAAGPAGVGSATLASDAVLPAASTLATDTGGGIASSVLSGAASGSLPAAAPGSLDAIATGADTVGGGFAGTGGAGGGFWSSLTGALNPSNLGAGIGKVLSSPTGLIGLGGLGLAGYEGYQQKQQLNALNNQEKLNASNANAIATQEQNAAAPLLNNGQTLMSYLTTNTLPPQFQSQVDQTVATMKAGIIQGYASRGMSTDPTKNSGLQQDLAAVDQQALTMKGNFETMLSTAGNQMVQTANQLLASGLSATQLSSEIPIQMAQLDANLNKQMSDALSNFAAAMNGGRGIAGNKTTNNLIGLG